jgi:hypothetical protein
MDVKFSGKSLKYPVFIIENLRTNKFTGFDIVYGSTGFSVWGRVPNSKKFANGYLFDANGSIFKYSGSSGWPRFSPRTCLVLDSLLIPGILSKLFERVGYFGPALTGEEHVDVEEFKIRVVASIEKYGSKDLTQLKSLLSQKTDFISILEAVDWWRYHGGKRDEDGHPV